MSQSIIDKINKPTLKMASLSKIAIPALVAGSIISAEEDNPLYYMKEDQNAMQIDTSKEISLWEFSRLYKIGQIPILDIILIYIILYLFNSLFLNYNFKFVLILVIPVTILFNVLTNKEFKISWLILLLFIISVYYLYRHNFSNM